MNTPIKPFLFRLAAISLGLLLCAFIAIGGFFIAPELRRTVAEAGIRELIHSRYPDTNGDILNGLMTQITTPPTLIERLLADIFSSSEVWPHEDLVHLSDLLLSSLLVGVDQSALQIVQRPFPVSEISHPLETSTSWQQQLSVAATPLLEIVRKQKKGAEEEARLTSEIEPLESQCATIRNEMAVNLGLSVVRAINLPCKWYGSGPLQGLPKLSLLRLEPLSMLDLIQSLRAAGSTLPLETEDSIDRLKPLFSPLQRKMAIISPRLVNLLAQKRENDENQRKLKSAHFVHQERFLDSLLSTIHSVRYQKLQAPLRPIYQLIADLVVPFIIGD
jgi:hypothetical protein